MNKTVRLRITKQQSIDLISIQLCLAFLPLDTIKTCVPLQRHWKPCFPHLNVHQPMEPLATDTFFANRKALGGDTCAQVFYGIQSRMITAMYTP